MLAEEIYKPQTWANNEKGEIRLPTLKYPGGWKATAQQAQTNQILERGRLNLSSTRLERGIEIPNTYTGPTGENDCQRCFLALTSDGRVETHGPRGKLQQREMYPQNRTGDRRLSSTQRR
jgi:hypothetical protein